MLKAKRNCYIGIWIILLFLLNSCQSSSTLQSESSVQTMPTDGLIYYQRVGGIAGLDDQLVVLQDGTLTLRRRGKGIERKIEPQQLQDLQTLLNEIAWESLQQSYLPAKQGADYLAYTIRYSTYTIKTVDTATPNELQPLLSLLNEIIKNSQ